MTHAFTKTPRQRLTDQQRAKLFLDRGGRCEGPCGRKLSSADVWHLDHRVSLENGGSNSEDNLQVLCEWCHGDKTPRDRRQAAKGRAVAVACVIPTSQRQKKGPPMPGSRRSKWKRHVDGRVTLRERNES